MISTETPSVVVRRARRKITYTWEEYLAVIQMMDDGNPIQDEFEVLPPNQDNTNPRTSNNHKVTY